MNNKLTFTVSLVACVIGISSMILSVYGKRKIVYVRSQVVIDRYDGTREARKKLEIRKSSLLANADSLRLNFERDRSDYLKNINRISPSQRNAMEKRLASLQEQYVRYDEAIQEKIREDENQTMQQVLNQINSFVESYSRANNYDLVMGTTLSGNLLYGKEDMDITSTLLDAINRNYHGK